MTGLCLFTNEFPYGNWEPYLETEVAYYNKFNNIKIFSLQLRKDHAINKRNINCNAEIYPVYYASNLTYLLYAFVALVDKNLYKEISKLIKDKKLNLKRLIQLFIFVSRSHYEANYILKKYSKKDFTDNVFYSYRFEYQPYVALLIKKKLDLNVKIICRAHGFDLYEENRETEYIPMREILLNNIEKVYPCSDYGSLYLKNKFSKYSDKIETKFLGTLDYGPQIYRKGKCLRLVSCSNVVPVKRLDLLIESLSKIDTHEIERTHYGDGYEMKKIKDFSKKLNRNIKVIFKGRVSNNTLLQEYKENVYDWFINVSSSEGIPVSIMEAMSFGIPCLATDVGGTSEIVSDGINGKLLSPNIKDNELAKVIKDIYKIKDEKYLELRRNSRLYWDEKFNSDNNYIEFINSIYKIKDSQYES